MSLIWINGQLVDKAETRISVFEDSITKRIRGEYRQLTLGSE